MCLKFGLLKDFLQPSSRLKWILFFLKDEVACNKILSQNLDFQKIIINGQKNKFQDVYPQNTFAKMTVTKYAKTKKMNGFSS